MFSLTFRKSLFSSLLKKPYNSLITHKFYYGQGGQLTFDLTKRNYSIEVQTIWEDYCQLEIQGLTGVQNFELYEEQGRGQFGDASLQEKLDEKIEVKLKIPEDYTMKGTINGNLSHIQSQVGRKLRSNPFTLTILGHGHSLNLGDVKTESVKISNQHGHVSFAGLTVQEGEISALSIESKKIMTSISIHLQGELINLRSILMFGPAKGYLKGKKINIDSVSGYSEIQGETVKIDRIYAGTEDIHIKCDRIQGKLGVETGTGTIELKTESSASEDSSKVVLGRLHKGSSSVSGTTIQIL